MNGYIDPETGVFLNKLGITDRMELEAKEYAVSHLRAAER